MVVQAKLFIAFIASSEVAPGLSKASTIEKVSSEL